MKVEKKPKKKPKYAPQCSVCQFMKKNKDFRDRVFASSYFSDDTTKESPVKINKSYGEPFKQVTMYACLKRHWGHLMVREASRVVDGKLIIDKRMKPTFEVIENVPQGMTEHEIGLDEFIREGRAKLQRGELQITATTYLTAIKTKMDNDAKTKDRRLDMLSGLFKGAAPKKLETIDD